MSNNTEFTKEDYYLLKSLIEKWFKFNEESLSNKSEEVNNMEKSKEQLLEENNQLSKVLYEQADINSDEAQRIIGQINQNNKILNG